MWKQPEIVKHVGNVFKDSPNPPALRNYAIAPGLKFTYETVTNSTNKQLPSSYQARSESN